MKKYKIKYTTVPFKIALLVLIFFLLSFYTLMVERDDYIEHMRFVRSIFPIEESDGYLRAMRVYPLWHFTTRIVSFICINNFSIGAVCVSVMANVAAIILMRKLILLRFYITEAWKRYVVDAISIGYVIFMPVAGWLTDGRIYARQCGPNPWQSPTYTFVRPIGILVIMLCFRALDFLSEDNVPNDKYNVLLLLFSLITTVSVFAKPSFVLVFIPAIITYLFFYWVRNKNRAKNIAKIIIALVMPMIALLIQFIVLQFHNEATAGTFGIHLGGFSNFSLLEIIKVSIATFPVPLLAIALYGKTIFDPKEIQLSFWVLLIGVVEMFLLTNGASGDFSWGYDLAVGLATLVTLAYALSREKIGGVETNPFIWSLLVADFDRLEIHFTNI